MLEDDWRLTYKVPKLTVLTLYIEGGTPPAVYKEATTAYIDE